MTFIRVETMDNKKGKTAGGYECSLHTLLAIALGVAPPDNDEELEKLISESLDKPEVRDSLSAMLVLNDIPRPEIYVQDKDNYVCLYRWSEFDECYEDLADISLRLIDATGGKMNLIYKEFDIREDEIVYEDQFQIVISKQTYDKYNKDVKCDDLLSCEMYDDYSDIDDLL